MHVSSLATRGSFSREGGRKQRGFFKDRRPRRVGPGEVLEVMDVLAHASFGEGNDDKASSGISLSTGEHVLCWVEEAACCEPAVVISERLVQVDGMGAGAGA